MLFTVVIPTCNRYAALRSCLLALEPQARCFPPGEYEIIVSDDTRPEALEPDPVPDMPFVKIVTGPRRGPASNRNCGAARALGEWLIFLDDDVIPQPGLLHAYAKAMDAHPECHIFEGRTVADRPKVALDEESPETHGGGFLWSCNIAVRRKLFER